MRFALMDVGHGFYMAKFDEELDRNKVMEEGPWMIFGHYLLVQTWFLLFFFREAKIEKTLLWVRFSSLNLLFYFLLALIASIGKPIKVDSNIVDVRLGRFSQVCVKID